MIRLNIEWEKGATDRCGRALNKIHIIHAFHSVNQNKSKTDFITIIDPQAAFAIR